MQGLRIGHKTLENKGTGVTAFIFDRPAVGAYTLCGSSPAAHELSTLDLDVNVTHVNGLLLSGGSAFGLGAAAGAMRWFQEQGIGWHMPHGVVPIIPAVAIYDLSVKLPAAPSADDAYDACGQATEGNIAQGLIGAGTGASVGKAVKTAARMSGGLGVASLTLGAIDICVYAVVNSVGDVRDTAGKIIAGARYADGKYADSEKYMLTHDAALPTSASNSTLVAVFTNAAFSKIQLKRISKMALAGMARAVTPIFTQYDGDVIFCLSLGDETATEIFVGTAAARLVQTAIINAVQNSIVLAEEG